MHTNAAGMKSYIFIMVVRTCIYSSQKLFCFLFIQIKIFYIFVYFVHLFFFISFGVVVLGLNVAYNNFSVILTQSVTIKILFPCTGCS